MNYLMNVAKYFNTLFDLQQFSLINKKCQEALFAFKRNLYISPDTAKKELILFKGIQNYYGTNNIENTENYEYLDIEGSIDGLPVNKIREWHTNSLIDNINQLISLTRLYITIGGDIQGWESANSMKWNELSKLPKLQFVKLILEDAPSTPIEDNEIPRVHSMLLDIIKQIGFKPIIVVSGCSKKQVSDILALGYNIKVIQEVQRFEDMSAYTSNPNFIVKLNGVEGETMPILNSHVIDKYALEKVKFEWTDEHGEGKNPTVDLRKLSVLKSFNVGPMDVNPHWLLPTSLTSISALKQDIGNMSEMVNLESLTYHQIQHISLPSLTELVLYQSPLINATDLQMFSSLIRLELRYYQNAEKLDLSSLPLRYAYFQNCTNSELVLPSTLQTLDLVTCSLKGLICPQSTTKLVLNGLESLENLSCDASSLETFIFIKCNNVKPFTLPTTLTSLRIMKRDQSKVQNADYFIKAGLLK
ncbi:Leucine-rich repeat containing protein [Entamoeba marina]